MAKRNFELHDGKRGAALAVRITPRASKTEIVGVLHDGTVKIHVMAAPDDGAANDELIGYLAGMLGVPKSRIEVVAGAAGRDKLISVLDMDAEALHAKIVQNMG
jgi:uncharacterized protein (TIGR00251 family)